MKNWWSGIRRLILPAIVFQAVLSGGAYASGRELIEYIIRFGTNGRYAIAVVALGFAVSTYLSAEVARSYQAYNYRKWAVALMGRGWVVFDALFAMMAVIVLAVVSSTAASVLAARLGLSYALTVAGIIAAIALLTGAPRLILERFESITTLLLTGLFITVLVLWSRTSAPAAEAGSEPGWLVSALLYIGYNLIVIPSCLFTFEGLKSRRDTVIASALAGFLAVVPIICAYIAMVGSRASLLTAEVPILSILAATKVRWVAWLYYAVLSLTLVDTGVGILHAARDRVSDQLLEHKKPALSGWRAVLAGAVACGVALVLAQFGVIALVARGFSSMAVAFIVVYAGTLLRWMFFRPPAPAPAVAIP